MFFQLGLWNEVWIWYVLKGLTFSISVSKFTLFQLVSNICEFPQPPLLQNLSRQHVHATGPSIMAQLESRLGLLTTAKVSCSSASEKAGYFYRSQAMHSWCLQTLWIYLPFQSILWFELPIYLQINLLTIICQTWTTMSSPARSILRQIPWTKRPSKLLPARGACCNFTFKLFHLKCRWSSLKRRFPPT